MSEARTGEEQPESTEAWFARMLEGMAVRTAMRVPRGDGTHEITVIVREVDTGGEDRGAGATTREGVGADEGERGSGVGRSQPRPIADADAPVGGVATPAPHTSVTGGRPDNG